MRSVLLVDDQALFRKALASLLSDAGWEVVGEAANGNEAVELAHKLKPDLVLMDIRMPDMNGLEATRLIKGDDSNVNVVILTVSDEEDDLFEALKIGANGYMLKNVRPELLFELLEGVFLGEIAITPAVAVKILDEFFRRTRAVPAPEASPLTRREKDILQLVARGASNRGIAAALDIGEGTVKSHLHRILQKLHLPSRTQAVVWAMRGGIISLGHTRPSGGTPGQHTAPGRGCPQPGRSDFRACSTPRGKLETPLGMADMKGGRNGS